MRSNTIEISPVGACVGAEIAGIDLREPLAPQVRETVQQAMNEHGVVFFRDQALTEDQHISLARQFGDININRFFSHVPTHPEIALVVKEPDQTRNIGGGWHTDHSYDRIPAVGSMLYAREIPPKGGDTLFASMYAAYDALSDGLKQTLEGMRGVQSSRHVFGVKRGDLEGRIGNYELATQDATHPVVITHPDSGRKALYVNPGFTIGFDGWTADESRPLLEYLYRHAQKPEFSCRFQWQVGSLAFWDNRSTWHYALNDYQGERRLLHRITIEGVALG